ncbi:nicolin-1-like [Watersipora subatra]|uniref:nicolin-1-like n=1 Tax=Watersipora subatra TaxID=2589382 RepID=UPI00355C3CE4
MANQKTFHHELELKEAAIASTSLQTIKASTSGSNNVILLGCKILTVNFSDSSAVDVQRVEFVNKYTGYVVISAKFKIQLSSETGSTFKFEWKKVSTKKLMPNPHYATGAESKFVINADELVGEVKNICSLKFVLHQPSVQFTEFSIEGVKVFTPNQFASPSDSLTQWVLKSNATDSSKRSNAIQDFPRIDQVSLALQKMWAFGKKTSNITNSLTQPKRFDKDGCYDINLLAY